MKVKILTKVASVAAGIQDYMLPTILFVAVLLLLENMIYIS